MSKGFTTVELILVMALFGVMASIVVIPLSTLQADNALKDASSGVVEAIRRANTQALSGHFGDSWGMHFSDTDGCALPASSYGLFRGESFVSATDTTETFDLPATVTISSVSLGGGCDLKFSRFHGISASAGDVVLSGANGAVRVISINAYGRVVER